MKLEEILFLSPKELAKITNINLRHSGVGDEGAIQLVKILPKMISLTHLYLGWNNIKEDGATALAEILPQMKSLTRIELEGNIIGVYVFTDCIKNLPNLIIFNGKNNENFQAAINIANKIINGEKVTASELDPRKSAVKFFIESKKEGMGDFYLHPAILHLRNGITCVSLEEGKLTNGEKNFQIFKKLRELLPQDLSDFLFLLDMEYCKGRDPKGEIKTIHALVSLEIAAGEYKEAKDHYFSNGIDMVKFYFSQKDKAFIQAALEQEDEVKAFIQAALAQEDEVKAFIQAALAQYYKGRNGQDQTDIWSFEKISKLFEILKVFLTPEVSSETKRCFQSIIIEHNKEARKLMGVAEKAIDLNAQDIELAEQAIEPAGEVIADIAPE